MHLLDTKLLHTNWSDFEHTTCGTQNRSSQCTNAKTYGRTAHVHGQVQEAPWAICPTSLDPSPQEHPLEDQIAPLFYTLFIFTPPYFVSLHWPHNPHLPPSPSA
ncbi:hypothetical protein M758_5G010600 [Ceratodon purpureus]|uniref:Uncharacterized protein n=1 Tax=Ceratodon purpureus TaxID=3225 RepID=A0A8T0HXW5_CERPU|nr:hypothetical protein KC19_5G009300 [Ceratodon purpureus]KAG0615049.1 hypothetical protein M758_5G010600 [Ceratodon purpureus]